MEEIILIFYNLFYEPERTLLNSFYKSALITLTSKSDEESIRKEKYRPIALMNIDAKILKMLTSQIINV